MNNYLSAEEAIKALKVGDVFDLTSGRNGSIKPAIVLSVGRRSVVYRTLGASLPVYLRPTSNVFVEIHPPEIAKQIRPEFDLS